MYEFTSREEQSTEHRKLRAAEKVNSFTCRGISNLGGGGRKRRKRFTIIARDNTRSFGIELLSESSFCFFPPRIFFSSYEEKGCTFTSYRATYDVVSHFITACRYI